MKWIWVELNDRIAEKKSFRPHLKAEDRCFYAREYQAGKNWKAGETNQLISNFKKPRSLKTIESQGQTVQVVSPEWSYREKAVQQFQKEWFCFFEDYIQQTSDREIAITSIPSSKAKTHPEYDNRFEDLFEAIAKTFSKRYPDVILNIEWPVKIKNTMPAFHISSANRLPPRKIKANYQWKGFKQQSPKNLFIIDDVITTGAHFRAMSDFLRENKYKGNIWGIFWAKAIRKIGFIGKK